MSRGKKGRPRLGGRVAAAWAAVVLLGIAVVPALAFLSARTASVPNVLSVGEEKVEIVEDFDPNPKRDGWVKKNVRVRNTGNVPCYVRALAVPSTSKFECTFSWGSSGWSAPDASGYRTYRAPLAPGELSPPLLGGLYLDSPSEPRDLQVLVYVESVQSRGFQSAQAAFAALRGEEES
ncbi:hypothetical protein AAK967_02530 [Atopobiaceae bacterium 24-176]